MEDSKEVLLIWIVHIYILECEFYSWRADELVRGSIFRRKNNPYTKD